MFRLQVHCSKSCHVLRPDVWFIWDEIICSFQRENKWQRIFQVVSWQWGTNCRTDLWLFSVLWALTRTPSMTKKYQGTAGQGLYSFQILRVSPGQWCWNTRDLILPGRKCKESGLQVPLAPSALLGAIAIVWGMLRNRHQKVFSPLAKLQFK